MHTGPHHPPPVPRRALAPEVPAAGADIAAPPSRATRVRARLRRVAHAARRALPFAGGVAAALIAVILYGALNAGPPPLTREVVASQIADAIASQPPAPPLAAAAYAAVQSSLVIVEAQNAAASPAPTGELGSGVIVNASGEILTALHVVAGATTIRITFADGSTSPATIASSEPDKDIAVLQPQAVPVSATPAVLGNPNSIRIGSDAFVTGNPFGLTGSLSAGVISGLNRTFTDPATDRVFHGLIQIDAAVNPGNSGGPLLDRSGRVIGIVTALVNPTGQRVFIGVGLAVPIDVAGGGAGLPRA